MRTKPAKEELK
jgi:hypothetical protein